MAIKITIENPSHVGTGVWLCEMTVQEIKLLGSAKEQAGNISIVLVLDTDPPSHDISELTIDRSHARLLNAGSTNTAILVYANHWSNGRGGVRLAQGSESELNDDKIFLDEIESLPKSLRALGRKLYDTIRAEFGGYFDYSSGRFVNRPDNFWTIRIQPRDQSFAITVRGNPPKFGSLPEIRIQSDRAGYSRFKLNDPKQFDAVWQILLKARQK